MKKCVRCGSSLLDSADRCFTCGTTLQGPSSAGAAPPPATEPSPDLPPAASEFPGPEAPLNPYAPPHSSLTSSVPEETHGLALVPISVPKLVILSILTWGLYEVYWHWKQWKQLKLNGDDGWPILRAIFSGITFFFLASRIQDHHRFHDSPSSVRPGLLGIFYLGTAILWRLPGSASFLGFLTVIPLALAQSSINDLNRRLGLTDPGPEIRTGTVIAGLLGLLLWVLSVYGLFVLEAE